MGVGGDKQEWEQDTIRRPMEKSRTKIREEIHRRDEENWSEEGDAFGA